MMGRFLFSVLASVPKIGPLKVHNVSLLGAGISCICMPFCTSFISIAISAFGYGFSMGKSLKIAKKNLTTLIDWIWNGNNYGKLDLTLTHTISLSGGHGALSPIVLVELIGLDRLTSAYGIITLVKGISTLMSGPLAGIDHWILKKRFLYL